MNLPGYLAGCLALAVVAGLGLYSGGAVRRRLVPELNGPAARLATGLFAISALLVPALLLGSVGLLTRPLWLLAILVLSGVLWWVGPGPTRPVKNPLPPVPSGPGLLATGPALAIAAAVGGIAVAASTAKLATGMTAFDSQWYHGPLAAGIAQSGSTVSLPQLAPDFLSWFYPQNSELVHALGLVVLGNDLASPLLNLVWLAGCLAAAWAIGRPWGVAPISLAAVALVLGSAALADQAGEARNDLAGTFFILAGLAILLEGSRDGRRLTTGLVATVGLAAGLAAGTKLNLLPGAAVLAGAALWQAAPATRKRAGGIVLLAVAVGGGYWYLRNLVHSGNPLPWIDSLGPLPLPAPDQDIGGRAAGSVWGYLADWTVVRDWFVPGLRSAFGSLWPVLLAVASGSVLRALLPGGDRARRAAALVVVALVAGWMFAPTSASGPAGAPAGFVSGLRYLAPGLAGAMALLGPAWFGPGRFGRAGILAVTGLLVLMAPFVIDPGAPLSGRYAALAVLAGIALWLVAGWLTLAGRGGRIFLAAVGLPALAALVIAGYPVQRNYFEQRYVEPDYVTVGLGASFEWARDVKGERIATNASRMYPLFGVKVDNPVEYVAQPGPRGALVKPADCRSFRQAVNRIAPRFLVTALDRAQPLAGMPRESAWVEGDPAAAVVLRAPGATVFELDGKLDPDRCP